jgi:hypothetical protein
MSQEFPVERAQDHSRNGLGSPVTGSPFVAAPFLAAAIRRRWRLWMTTAVAGVIAAIGLSLAFPPQYTATATVLLGHHPGSDPAKAMLTDQELLQTTAVARGALDRLGLRQPATTFRTHYDGRSLSPDLLRVRARGTTRRDAVRRADAVAQSLLAFRADELRRQSQLAVQALQERQNPLVTELDELNRRINSAATDPTSDPGTRAFGDLLSRRATLGDELAVLRQQAQTLTTETRAVIAKSRIVDPANPDPRSPFKAMIFNVAAGIVGGIFVGLAWIVGHEILSDRLRRRADIAAILDVPVAISIGQLRGPHRRQRQRFVTHLSRPNPDLAQMARHLRSCLSRSASTRPGLIVVSVDSDWASALAVAATAADLTAAGQSVLLADLSRESVLAGVLTAPTGRTSQLHLRPAAAKLWLTFPDGESPRAHRLEQVRKDAAVVLVLASLDPSLGADHLVEWATTAVALVTAGRSTATALRSTRQMLSAAGVELDSAILIGAGKDDETAGVSGRSPSRPVLNPDPVWSNR